MTIPLLPGAQLEAAKVYPLGLKDREVVDKEFDQLHEEEKMDWTTKPTPHGHPVFVVWSTVDGHSVEGPSQPQREGTVVVDIRLLNRVTKTDSYPMPLQTDITSAVRGCPYISTMDASAFFHQWPVKVEHRYRLTAVSRRGQEQYHVAPMGYKNSSIFNPIQFKSIHNKW